jgi:predicted transposase YbfD/YdcC
MKTLIESLQILEDTRDHWNIECDLHWKLDVIMDEDHSRNRVGNSIVNLSTLTKIAFNLASLDNSFNIVNKKVPLQRKITNYMLDFSKV